MSDPAKPGSPPSGTIFQVGDLLNNTYRIEAILGRGGTSEVYRARTISGKLVAVKVLRSELADDEGFLSLMNREEDIREIRHDAILPYFHNQRTESGRVFLVMDYVEGVSLDRRMREGGMDAEAILVLAERVAGGLRAAHAKRIVHRDLSPDNIILRGGDPADAVIIDFGIAKDINPGAQTVVGNQFAGKYAYCAPEQLNGQTDERSDVYSLGVVLMAAYLGQSPYEGMTPMEIVSAKSRPLDSRSLPQPLRSLIDRMTEPDRERRFQNASEVLTAIRDARKGAGDRTVIAPRPPVPQPMAPAAAKPSPSRGRGRPVALGVVALLAVAGAIGWGTGAFDRLLGPNYPVADPFTLVVERQPGGSPAAAGHVPSEEIQAALTERLADAGGSADLALAQGDIAETWGAGVLSLIDAAAPLDEWRLAISDNTAELTGMTENRALREQTLATVNAAAAPSGLEARAEIELGPRMLAPDRLQPILREHADCGSLRLIDPPAIGYPQDATILVGGQVATAGTKAVLAQAIGQVAGERDVAIETRVLNPSLCIVDAALPLAPPGGFKIALIDGETNEPRPDGTFFVGDNPVIEVTVPADVTEGWLYAMVIDVSGNAFNLLPNAYNEENAIAALRNGRTGPVTIRLSHPLADAEAAAGDLLAFNVDESTLGESRVLVLYAMEPIFDGARPTTLSVEALAEEVRRLEAPVNTLDSRALITAEALEHDGAHLGEPDLTANLAQLRFGVTVEANLTGLDVLPAPPSPNSVLSESGRWVSANRKEWPLGETPSLTLTLPGETPPLLVAVRVRHADSYMHPGAIEVQVSTEVSGDSFATVASHEALPGSIDSLLTFASVEARRLRLVFHPVAETDRIAINQVEAFEAEGRTLIHDVLSSSSNKGATTP